MVPTVRRRLQQVPIQVYAFPNAMEKNVATMVAVEPAGRVPMAVDAWIQDSAFVFQRARTKRVVMMAAGIAAEIVVRGRYVPIISVNAFRTAKARIVATMVAAGHAAHVNLEWRAVKTANVLV